MSDERWMGKDGQMAKTEMGKDGAAAGPTAIQREAIASGLWEGRDLVGIAETGAGDRPTQARPCIDVEAMDGQI